MPEWSRGRRRPLGDPRRAGEGVATDAANLSFEVGDGERFLSRTARSTPWSATPRSVTSPGPSRCSPVPVDSSVRSPPGRSCGSGATATSRRTSRSTCSRSWIGGADVLVSAGRAGSRRCRGAEAGGAPAGRGGTVLRPHRLHEPDRPPLSTTTPGRSRRPGPRSRRDPGRLERPARDACLLLGRPLGDDVPHDALGVPACAADRASTRTSAGRAGRRNTAPVTRRRRPGTAPGSRPRRSRTGAGSS